MVTFSDELFIDRHMMLQHLMDDHELDFYGTMLVMYRYGHDARTWTEVLYNIHSALPVASQCKNFQRDHTEIKEKLSSLPILDTIAELELH